MSNQINNLVAGGNNLYTYSYDADYNSLIYKYNGTTIWGGTVSKVRNSQCGTLLATLNTQIAANVIAGAQMYRFEVSIGSNVRTYETTKYNFDLTKLAGSTYGTTYAIRVAVKMNDIWGSFGASCDITTPTIASSIDVPMTNLRTADCGRNLATMSTPIHANLVYGAQAYLFEITSLADSAITVFESPIYYFNLTQLVGSGYATSYSIRVASKVVDTWGAFGTACTVTTPVLSASTIPTTKIAAPLCGATLASLNTKIAATTVYNAEGYRFEITTSGVTTVYDSALYLFKLSQAGVVVSNGRTYAIRVATKVGGIFGNYGASCTIMTPTSTTKFATETAENTEFALKAYPNPFNGAFSIQILGSSNETVSVLVYDMLGKQLENRVINANEIENILLGHNYATGIYNVILTQGGNTKTTRLIKK